MNEANNLSDNRLVFSKDLYVKSYDSDMFKQMSLPAIMRYLQEIAGEHLSLLGLPYEKLFSDKGQPIYRCEAYFSAPQER